MASIGSVCIQRPIKLRSHGEGAIGKDSGCQHCLYTYLSIPTHTGLNMNTREAFFFMSLLSSLFICLSQNLFNSLSIHLPLSKMFSRLFAFASPANTICLFRSVSTCILSLAFCFTCCVKCVTFCLMLRNAALRRSSSLPPPLPHCLAQNCQMAP